MTPSLVIEGRRRDLGGGVEVGRVLPFAQRRMVGPFIFFDHIGPIEFPPDIPKSHDVRPHPHIGLATITYLFAGEITHRDSTGVTQVIRPGEVNWMTAGSGITHSERFEGLRAHGGLLHGLQTWVALPLQAEETAPGFEHRGADELPEIKGKGTTARLIVGTAFGRSSPVVTYSPIVYLHVALEAGAAFALPAEHPEIGAYVVEGAVDADGQSYGKDHMLVYDGPKGVTVTAAKPTTLMVVGGSPVGERHIWWNYVSSRPERIEQAKADWQAGRMKMPINDTEERIPLPQ